MREGLHGVTGRGLLAQSVKQGFVFLQGLQLCLPLSEDSSREAHHSTKGERLEKPRSDSEGPDAA